MPPNVTPRPPLPPAPATAAPPGAPPTKPAHWTVLAYVSGDNNLSPYGKTDLGEMKRIGSRTGLNLLAQYDPAGGGGTRRFFLRKGTLIDADAVTNLGETNMGDSKVLSGFLEWGLTTYPSEKTCIILWNHGSGWDDANVYKAVNKLGAKIARKGIFGPKAGHLRALGRRSQQAFFSSSITRGVRDRAIAFDDQAMDFLDNVELKTVLTGTAAKLGRRIDLVAMDACMMNMLEVAYQLKDAVGMMVGSEETEPSDGWPYDQAFKVLGGPQVPTAAEFARHCVEAYLASYKPTDAVTQSALDLTRIAPAIKALDDFCKVLTAAVAEPAKTLGILRARNSTQAFDTPEYVDLLDFAEKLGVHSKDAKVKATAAALTKAVLESGFIVANGARGKLHTGCHGVSIYFPVIKPISPLYATLDFAQQTQWVKFLKAYREAAGLVP